MSEVAPLWSGGRLDLEGLNRGYREAQLIGHLVHAVTLSQSTELADRVEAERIIRWAGHRLLAPGKWWCVTTRTSDERPETKPEYERIVTWAALPTRKGAEAWAAAYAHVLSGRNFRVEKRDDAKLGNLRDPDIDALEWVRMTHRG